MNQSNKHALLEEILDLKAQGWSDLQIRKSLQIDNHKYDRLIKTLHKEDHFKIRALEVLTETVHRLRWTRMKALVDYQAYREGDQKTGIAKNANASIAALKRVIEIDIAIPKVCEQLGWKAEDLKRYLLPDKPKTGSETEDLSSKSEDELYDRYKRLVGSDS